MNRQIFWEFSPKHIEAWTRKLNGLLWIINHCECSSAYEQQHWGGEMFSREPRQISLSAQSSTRKVEFPLFNPCHWIGDECDAIKDVLLHLLIRSCTKNREINIWRNYFCAFASIIDWSLSVVALDYISPASFLASRRPPPHI